MSVLDNRPRCHYRRDVSESVGQVMGPTLAGEWLVLDEVRPDGDQFLAFFRNATTADFGQARP